MSQLITACLLVVMMADQPNRAELKQDLAAIIKMTPERDVTKQDVRHLEQTWRSINQLPELERAIWRNTFDAAVWACARLPEKTQDAAKLNEAVTFYRKILDQLDKNKPDLLTSHLQLRLATMLSRFAGNLPPARRKPLNEEAIQLNMKAAESFRKAGNKVMLVSALGNLSLLHFTTGQMAGANASQNEAVTIYESLPESYLKTIDLELEKPVDQYFAHWAKRGYAKQSEVYLLLALAKYNRGLKDATAARESIYLYAESLRVGIAHREVTAINNAGALLIQRGVGVQTGKARNIRHLNSILEWLPDAASNPHWRNREITKTGESLNWIHARVHHFLGEYYFQTGQALLARHHLREAKALAATLEDRAILPLVLYSLAETWAEMGVAPEAMRIAREGLDSDPGLSRKADILRLMGRVSFELNEIERAQDYYRWALDLFIKPGSFQLDASGVGALSKIQRGSAMLQLSLGKVADGLKLLGEAAGMAALEDPEEALAIQIDRLRTANWLANLTDSMSYRPHVELAVVLETEDPHPFESLAMTRGPNFSQTVKLVPSKGSPRKANDPDSLSLGALQIRKIRSAITVRDAVDPSEVIPKILRDIADLRMRLGDRTPAHFEFAHLALIEGDLETAQEHVSELLEFQWRAMQSNLDPNLGIESPERVQQVHHLATVVASLQGNPQRALQVLDMARHRALWQVQSSRQQVWDRLTNNERAEAAELDDLKTESATRVRQLSGQKAMLAGNPGAVDRLKPQIQKAEQKLFQDEARWRDFLQRVHQNHQVDLPVMEPLEQEQLKALMTDQSALLSYSVGDFETCVIAATRDGDSMRYASKVLPIRRHELESLVYALRMGCSARDGQYRVLARELYRVLITPMQDMIDDANLLVVCPDGPLNVLPFNVLENHEDVPLLQTHPVAVIPSLALLQRLRVKRSTKRSGALLVGVQEFAERPWVPSSYAGLLDRDAVSRLLPLYQVADLLHTRAEVERIANTLGDQATVLVNQDASESNVKKEIENRKFVHFATHGLIDSYNPFSSTLVLAEPGAKSREDGFLEASEILESSAFSGAELVTLSACESGLGLVQGGEGVLGLTWAFLAAGNRSVVSSLWSVDDEATADLMVGLYRELADESNKAEALRSAAMKVRENPATSHPAYWAAFQLTGDW